MPLPLAGEGAEWVQSIIMLMLLAFIISMMLRQMAESRQQPTGRKIVSVEDCGGRRVERPFSKGDYVGKETGSCDDGSPRVIVAIYAVKEQAEGKAQQAGRP